MRDGYESNQQSGASHEALSVSAAMGLAKGALEALTVRLVGEVSEVSCKPGYKAVYFTVKDKSAALPCMMWNNRYQASGVQLAVGALVELTGRFTLYAAKGRMNFDVFSVSLAGEGRLRLQVAQLAKKLELEGLMSSARKRPLPAFPQCIGVVTSPRGAAVHDVLRTLKRRFPVARVVLAGVAVEGARAPEELIEGLRTVERAGAEAVLLVRGGGSFEDLMPFNDEGLARAVAACGVPVVTGIGHEPDTSIADMVADVRASTPTAAAEAVSPAAENLEAALSARGRSLGFSLLRRIDAAQARVSRIAERPLFTDEAYLLAGAAQTADMLAERLVRALPSGLERDAARLASLEARLLPVMQRRLAADEMRMDAASDRLIAQGCGFSTRFANDAALRAARLHDLSPLAVLGRGYAIARTQEGSVVGHVEDVCAGDEMNVQVSDGVIVCQVREALRCDDGCASGKER